MSNHTFAGLSAADFEDLCCDLLTKALELRFQSFPQGPDRGIDLLHGQSANGGTIVQCKHFAKSGYSKLSSALKNQELPKLQQLNPSRYIVCTSVELTYSKKESLARLLDPYCRSISDIYGADEIRALLRQNPDIERQHYKLWLTSAEVLNSIFATASVIWNAMTKRDIEQKLSLFVQSEAFSRAIQLLKNEHVCIISGIPGIGKTTLAQIIALRHLEDGYQLVAVRDDIREAFRSLDASKKQLLYYDDFLGRTSLGDRLGKNEDSSIARLIQEARKSRHLRVLFTTREYILKDAQRLHEPLDAHSVGLSKCILALDDYSRAQKARLLYNHLYFSGVDSESISQLVRSRTHRQIIDHDNFSPRIVEWMTTGAGPSGVLPSEYGPAFLEKLRFPHTIWEHAFDNQIDSDSRALLYCLATLSPSTSVTVLQSAWARFLLKNNEPVTYETRSRFQAALRQCEGTFTLTDSTGSGPAEETAISFHNPSIQDYLNNRIAEDPYIINQLLMKCEYFQQLEFLIHLSTDGKKSGSAQERILNRPEFVNTIERVIRSKPSQLYLSSGGWSSASRYRFPPRDIGLRLARACSWALDVNSTEVFSTILSLAQNLWQTCDENDFRPEGLARFLSAVLIADPAQYSEHLKFISQIIEWVASQVALQNDVDAWTAWSELIFDTEILFKFDDELIDRSRIEVDDFCSCELDAILDQSDSAEELIDSFAVLEDILRWWDLDREDAHQMFEQRLDELNGDEPDFDCEYPTGGLSGGDLVGSDSEIDRLFDTLDSPEEN